MKTAREIANEISEWVAKEIEPQHLPGRVKIELAEKVEQALLAAGPRVVSDAELMKLAADYVAPPDGWTDYDKNEMDFVAGFRAAGRLNAVRCVEDAWPSEAEIEKERWGEIAKVVSGQEKTGNSWTACATWLRAEVLRRLGEK